MKRLLLAITLLGVTALSSFAQSSSPASSSPKAAAKFSIGLEGGLPVGDASNAYNAVIGGSVKYELPTAPNAFFTISAGYNAFLLKGELKGLGIPSTAGFIPLKAGIKYYSEGGFFLEGQLGIVFSTESGGGHAFVYAPGIGYSFSGGFEAGVRYEGWSNGGTTSQVGLRLAVRF